MGKAFTIIGKIAGTLILTGMLGYGAFFAFIMVICTGGGALLIVGPIALVVLPLYVKVLRAMWGKKSTNKSDTHQIKMTKEEIALVKYILDARSDGTADNEIRSQFLTAGWSGDEIDRAFTLAPLRAAT